MNVQYAAGLIDGEGWIGVSHTKADTYTIRVAVAMVTKGTRVLSAMRDSFGGRLSEMKPESERNAAKTRWTVDGAEAASFLAMVAPHLILKGQQAQVALQMWEDLEASRKAHGRKHWTPELRQRCEVAKRRIHELNSRGPKPLPPPLPNGSPVAVYRWGWWWEPEDDLFGPVEFEGKLPTCGQMVAGHVYATTPWEPRTDGSASSSSPLLPTPNTAPGEKGRDSGQDPERRRALGRQVELADIACFELTGQPANSSRLRGLPTARRAAPTSAARPAT